MLHSMLNGDCDDCDRDPTACIDAGQCALYSVECAPNPRYVTCGNCGCCTFVKRKDDLYCIECGYWHGRSRK